MIYYNEMDWQSFANDCRSMKNNKLKGDRYINASCSFDIETSTKDSLSFMYLWGFSFFNKYIVYGRTWDEFISFFDKLEEVLKQVQRKIFIYVHNLNFEYSFMYEFIKDKITDTFAKGERDILYFKTKETWWRCSMKLTRLKLEDACFMYNTDHQKLSGEEYNYNKLRYPWTELTDYEFKYFEHDLICVNELVEAVMLNKGEKKLTALPMTLTGFTRRKAKRNCDSIDYHMLYKRLSLTPEIYGLAEDSQKGGSCECAFYQKNIIHKNVECWDYISQHIYIMLCQYFPMGRFNRFIGDENNIEVLIENINKWCCLFDIVFDEIELKPEKDFGIIATSHIQNIKEAEIELCVDYRLIRGKNIKLSLNEIDFNNIMQFYNFKVFRISNLYIARRGRLPWQLREVLWNLYQEKCELKKYKNTDKQFIYDNKKQELNSFSGMIQTKIIHPQFVPANDGSFEKQKISNADRYYMLDGYSNNFAHFLYYPWGNWIISHSRKMVYDLIDCCEKHLYHDTDSCYGINFNPEKLEALNKQISDTTKSYGYNLDHLGEASLEHKDIEFKMIGLKNYAIKENGIVKTTMAGIPKEASQFLNNDLNNFKLGAVLPGMVKNASYKSLPIFIIVDTETGQSFKTAGYCTITNQDLIIKNWDSKMDLIEGGMINA